MFHFPGTSVLRVTSMNRRRPRRFLIVRAAMICAVIGAGRFTLQSVPAWGQEVPVTIDDLQGTVLEASVTEERVIRQKGKERPSKYQFYWKIRFISPDTIHTSFVGTSVRCSGTEQDDEVPVTVQ